MEKHNNKWRGIPAQRMIILVLVLISTGTLLAQGMPPRSGAKASLPTRERIESIRIAFYTREMKLTPEEATVFWPVFNKYQEEEKALRIKHPLNEDGASARLVTLTEEEATRLLDEVNRFADKERDIRKRLTQEVAKTLSPKKALLFIQAEKNFRKELVQQVKARQ